MSQDPANATTGGPPSAGGPAVPDAAPVEAAMHRFLDELERLQLPEPAQDRLIAHAVALLKVGLDHSLEQVRAELARQFGHWTPEGGA